MQIISVIVPFYITSNLHTEICLTAVTRTEKYLQKHCRHA